MATTKGKPGKAGWQALATHSAIHAGGTLVITLIFAPGLWWLALVDFTLHGSIDRLKGILTNEKGWCPKDKMFWWSFGIDQEAHNFTHFGYLLIILLYSGGLVLS